MQKFRQVLCVIQYGKANSWQTTEKSASKDKERLSKKDNLFEVNWGIWQNTIRKRL